jgi:hypothetical protein
MIAKQFASLLLLSFPVVGICQVRPQDTTTGVFSKWANIFQANKDVNTLGIGPWKVNGEGTVPPVFEAQIRQPFLLLKGRDNQRPWKRSLMINFLLGLDLRMYQGPGNESHPVRPMNFIVPGFTVDYLLNHFFRSKNKIALEDSSKIKNFFNYQIHVSHFSNGQTGSFYTRDSMNTNKINGDFLTNIFRQQITWSRHLKNASLVTAGVGYTHDFGIKNFMEIQRGLRNSYGFNKLHLILLWRTQNKQLGYYTFKSSYYKKDPKDTSRYITRVSNKGRYKRYASFLLRGDFGYILDRVDDYPTFKNKSDKKLRGNAKFTVGYYPANMRSLGVFTQLYYGRDYYNIRYTEKLVNFKFGLLFDINKYIPPNTQYLPRSILNN